MLSQNQHSLLPSHPTAHKLLFIPLILIIEIIYGGHVEWRSLHPLHFPPFPPRAVLWTNLSIIFNLCHGQCIDVEKWSHKCMSVIVCYGKWKMHWRKKTAIIVVLFQIINDSTYVLCDILSWRWIWFYITSKMKVVKIWSLVPISHERDYTKYISSLKRLEIRWLSIRYRDIVKVVSK